MAPLRFRRLTGGAESEVTREGGREGEKIFGKCWLFGDCDHILHSITHFPPRRLLFRPDLHFILSQTFSRCRCGIPICEGYSSFTGAAQQMVVALHHLRAPQNCNVVCTMQFQVLLLRSS